MLKPSRIVLTRERKIKMLIGTIAIKLAKKNNDSLYKRYAKARQIMLKLRKAIIKRYRNRARQIVLKAIRKKKS